MYRYDGDEIDDAELDGLLTEADCELTLDTDEGSDLEALLVILSPTLQDDESLRNILVWAVNSGLLIVCIWAKGLTSGSKPKSIEKYSTDQIIWDSDRLRRALQGDNVPQYDAVEGIPRPEPFTRRNPC